MVTVGEIVKAEKILEGAVIGNLAKECQHCGEHKDDVELVIDPYAAGVYGEEVLMRLCKGCIVIREDDI
jgi:hypothetical protein